LARPAQGPLVLFVHGTGLNGRVWDPVAEALNSAGVGALALDLRGHGRSGRSPDARYSWDRFAADVLAAVHQLGLAGREVAGAGHSAGATALLEAEALEPGTFATLWLWEPIMGGAGQKPFPGAGAGQEPFPGAGAGREPHWRRGADLAERARHRRSHFASIAEARAHFAGRGIFSEFSPAALEGFLAGGLVAVAQPVGGVRLACQPEDEARIYEAGDEHDARAQLGRVRCPARVLGGSGSPAVRADELSAIAAALPAGNWVVEAGLGHFGPFQAPQLVAADLTRWLAGLPSDGAPSP